MSRLNQTRANVKIPASDMKLVVWDNDLETALIQWLSKTNNPQWFFEKWPPSNTLPDFKANFNGLHLFDLDPLPPEFDKLSGNYTFLFHDTCNNEEHCVSKIVESRSRQAPCFRYKGCNSIPLGYNSCATPEVTGQKCTWWYQYYPRFVQSEVETIACVLLGIPGPGTPTGQPNSFWCYGRLSQEGMNIPTGLPYEKGRPCSRCPASHPICVNEKLCASQ